MSTTKTYPVPTSYPWKNVETYERCIKFYPKKNYVWKTLNAWLENEYPAKHWTWRGFGEIGTDEYFVTLVRRPCSSWSCKCGEFESDSEEE